MVLVQSTAALLVRAAGNILVKHFTKPCVISKYYQKHKQLTKFRPHKLLTKHGELWYDHFVY